MKVENKKSKYAGFSLMEMIVAIFVFSIVMTTVMAVFVNVSTSRKKIKAIQKDVEDARFGMELMAKSLRMSSVVKCDETSTCDGSLTYELRVFDYSQGKCVRYKLDTFNHLQSSAISATGLADCDSKVDGDFTFSNMTGGNVSSLNFAAIKSDNTKFGKVTIAMKVCYKGICSGNSGDEANIQTTVSLRDYQVVDP